MLGATEIISVALIGLVGTFAIAGCSLAGVIFTTRRIGKPNGKGNVTQMLEKILSTLTDHGQRLEAGERDLDRQIGRAPHDHQSGQQYPM